MDFSRRDFNRLSMAALGGMLAGASGGCGGSDKPAPPMTQATPPPAAGEQVAAAPKEIHACRGLNSCKSLGADEKNACAGQGVCSTAKAHDCAGQNACKHQGGCGESPGYNDCKEKGGCFVPIIHEAAWEKARKTFEEKMKEQDKQFGAAPAKAEG